MSLTKKRTFGSVATVAIAILALADAPDQASKWWDGIVRAVSSIDGKLGLLLVALLVGLWAWDVHKRLLAKLFGEGGEPPQLRFLERYYMRLSLLQEEVDMALKVEMDDSHFIKQEISVDRLRGDLINLAPSVLTTATAMDLRKPDLQWTEAKKRLPEEIERLLKVVRHKWQAYGGK